MLVHLERGEQIPPYLGKLPLKYVDHINDPETALYASFDLHKGKLGQLVSPKVLCKGAKSVFTGHLPGKVGNDVRQMPGTFLLAHGEIVSAFRASDAGEQPDYEDMLADWNRYLTSKDKEHE